MLLRGRQQLSAKAMCVPSGDQLGKNASRDGSVSRRWWVPSAFMTQMAEMKPPLLLSKTIVLPSGENSGSPLLHTRLVSLVSLVPSAFMTYIAQVSWNG